MLYLGCREKMPWQEQRERPDEDVRTEAKVEIYEGIREWDYGEYEGLTTKTIKEQRQARGEGDWDIWRDGCPGGEYAPVLTVLEDGEADMAVDRRNRSPSDATS